jgi:hypothetical protein
MAQKEYRDVVTPEFRLVFPSIFEPKSFDDGSEPKYQFIAVFPKDADLTEVRQLVKDTYNEAFPKGANNAHSPFREGNEKVDDWGEVFKDATYIRCTSKRQPSVVDSSKVAITDADSVYSGCYARAVISAYSYDRTGNRGVSISFSAIQITRHGKKLGFDSSKLVNKFSAIDATDAFSTNDPFAAADAKNNEDPMW